MITCEDAVGLIPSGDLVRIVGFSDNTLLHGTAEGLYYTLSERIRSVQVLCMRAGYIPEYDAIGTTIMLKA